MVNTKIILFDVDEVLIRLPYYFSAELEKQGYKNVENSVNPFFTGPDNLLCSEGKADAEKLIMPYLEKFGWKKTAREYFDAQFQFEKKFLDDNLIELVKELKNENIICCLCTDQKEIRAKFLLQDLDFQNIFDKHFISCRIGYRKCYDEFWQYVIKELEDVKPEEIAFFDDKQSNVDVALKFGIRAFLFTDIVQFEKDISTIK